MFHLHNFFFKNETEEVIYFQNAVFGFYLFLFFKENDTQEPKES